MESCARRRTRAEDYPTARRTGAKRAGRPDSLLSAPRAVA